MKKSVFVEDRAHGIKIGIRLSWSEPTETHRSLSILESMSRHSKNDFGTLTQT